ncbi:AhpD family alkylhydroperoxidase [Microbacterium keratanolyticum]|uniref:Alkyl hydroperoxide reductase AhpD n=1 Tax=Microbacterium keratanolyticum TaxID=67574 RepID=A0A9W6M7P8_9MICO|nr:carboxymuconolactone decarboxylase family protein [Microbacterium keratanolyticum]MBM7468322.1 AhpD family alkylhydroperoxidase [Microbacterium keratanolyticum]GLK00396.1 alkyl hydroperoxide reductase AhpD [Microbacterium keratanolyticum]
MTRISIGQTNKLGYAAVIGMEAHARKSVPVDLLELLKLRASILNGCGFCVDMHATAGLKHRIPSRKLHAVGAWRHAKALFTERELAVLALTDALTLLAPDGVSDDVWQEAARHFDDGELGALVLAISTINVWNRIAIATEMQPPIDEKNPIA